MVIDYHSPQYQAAKQESEIILADLNAVRVEWGLEPLMVNRYTTRPILDMLVREGESPERCRKVINTKRHDPHFIAHPSLMSPTTLFKPEHFYKYISESPDDYETAESVSHEPDITEGLS